MEATLSAAARESALAEAAVGAGVKLSEPKSATADHLWLDLATGVLERLAARGGRRSPEARAAAARAQQLFALLVRRTSAARDAEATHARQALSDAAVSLLDACARSGDARGARAVYDLAESGGELDLVPDAYAPLFGALAADADVEGTLRALDFARANGTALPVGALNAALRVLARSWDHVICTSDQNAYCRKAYVAAVELLYEAKSGAGDKDFIHTLPAPNEASYDMTLAALGCAGDVESAKELFSVMRAAGGRPTEDSYRPLVDVLARCGRLSEAQKVLREMRVVTGRADTDAHVAVIRGLGARGDCAGVLHTLEKLERAVGTKDVAARHAAADALEHNGELVGARKLIDELWEIPSA